MYAFVPVKIGNWRFDAAGISFHERQNGNIVVLHPEQTVTLQGKEADAFKRWWDKRADDILQEEEK